MQQQLSLHPFNTNSVFRDGSDGWCLMLRLPPLSRATTLLLHLLLLLPYTCCWDCCTSVLAAVAATRQSPSHACMLYFLFSLRGAPTLALPPLTSPSTKTLEHVLPFSKAAALASFPCRLSFRHLNNDVKTPESDEPLQAERVVGLSNDALRSQHACEACVQPPPPLPRHSTMRLGSGERMCCGQLD